MIETNKPRERAILIGVLYRGQDESEVEDFLKELSFLTETAGAEPVKRSKSQDFYWFRQNSGTRIIYRRKQNRYCNF
jgi:hypothetical protein